VLFRGKGTIVVAFNAALADNGRIAGHSAVLYLGRYWDSEGDHPLDRITEYARLDVEDEEYATWYGTGWNTAIATTVRVAEYPVAELAGTRRKMLLQID
jgi:hypothetical protein